jgi:hypothetical protein
MSHINRHKENYEDDESISPAGIHGDENTWGHICPPQQNHIQICRDMIREGRVKFKNGFFYIDNQKVFI